LPTKKNAQIAKLSSQLIAVRTHDCGKWHHRVTFEDFYEQLEAVTAAALLGEADNQRIRAIRSRRWLIYPRAKQVLDRLNLLVDHPRGTRMPLAIYGDSGMGKTMITKRFRDQHPPGFNPLTGRLKTPVLAPDRW